MSASVELNFLKLELLFTLEMLLEHSSYFLLIVNAVYVHRE